MAPSPPAEPEKQLLARILLWERSEYVRALRLYLNASGRAYRFPERIDLPASVSRALAGRQGRFFELYTVPLDCRQLAQVLNLEPLRSGLEVTLELSAMPVLICLRKGHPMNPAHPEREFQPILDLVSRKRKDEG